MNIFISGATGVLGRRVVNQLASKNHRVVAFVRPTSITEQNQARNVKIIKGNLFNLNEVIKASKGCDIMLHLATHIPSKKIPKRPEDWLMNDMIRTDGTRNLIIAALDNDIEYFIQSGVALLYGQQGHGFVNSANEIAGDQPFMLKSAVLMEEMVNAVKSINSVIIRFSRIYSSDSVSTQQMIAGVKQRKMPIIEDGNYYWNNIHADDAAGAILYVIEHIKRLQNYTLNFSDFKPLTFASMVESVMVKTGAKKPLKMPKVVAKLILGEDLYRVFTDSYKIEKKSVIQGWNPGFESFAHWLKTYS